MPNKFIGELPRSFAIAANEYIARLHIPRNRSRRLIILAPFGPSCIGKTTTIRFLARRLPLVHIRHDELRSIFRKRSLNENIPLYRYKLAFRIAEHFLKKRISVAIDANFATHHRHLQSAERLAKPYNANVILIRVMGSRKKILARLRRGKIQRHSIFADRAMMIEHFLRSERQYAKTYERLTARALAVVDSTRPLPPQLHPIVHVLREIMLS